MDVEAEEGEQAQRPLAGGWRRALSPAALTERRELYQGFGDTLAVAFELAFTPVVVGLMGYGLDRWLGTLPVLMIVFVLMAIVGLSARMWYGYDARMRAHEANGPWARPVAVPAALPPGALIPQGMVEPPVAAGPDESPPGDRKGPGGDG